MKNSDIIISKATADTGSGRMVWDDAKANDNKNNDGRTTLAETYKIC